MDYVFDEFDLEFTHMDITRAIWEAKCSTEFIRKNFPISEAMRDKKLCRYYKISEEGYKVIFPYLKRKEN